MPSLIQDLYMIPFKLVEGVIYVTIAIIILKRNRKKLLNRTFFISILGWGIYILLDMILYPLAHFETTYWEVKIIDSTEVVIPFIANILRDVALCFAGLLTVGSLYASLILKHGENVVKKPKTCLAFIALYLGLVIPTIIFDQTIRVEDYVKSNFNAGSVIMILAQIVILSTGALNLVQLHFRFEDEIIRKRIGYFILGISSLPIGTLYFTFLGVAGLNQLAFITGPIGHLLWTLGALFIYKGMSKQ